MSISVLNIPLYDKPLQTAVDEVVQTCLYGTVKANRLVSATGAHGLVLAHKNEGFAHTLKSYHWNLPDGVPGVWVGRFKGAKRMERCYGPDFFESLLRASSNLPIKHFLCGGKEGVARDLAVVCAEKFKNGNCVGMLSPPFRAYTAQDYESLAERIMSSGAHIVWIGLGTPKQELFAVELSKYVRVHYIITVGAAFDLHTGRLRRAPRWFQRIGMEWFFRLLMEPRRLFGRYLEVVPLFLNYAARDLIEHYTKKNRGESSL